MATRYVQPSRRRPVVATAKNPNRLQHYYRFQVVIKPSPDNIQELLPRFSERAGHGPDYSRHPFRGVTGKTRLGAWGLGWEVWLNGMEVTQFLTSSRLVVWSVNRLPARSPTVWNVCAMYIQGVDSVYDDLWSTTAR
jgi:glycyl-tRNA synthetase alpha chain